MIYGHVIYQQDNGLGLMEIIQLIKNQFMELRSCF